MIEDLGILNVTMEAERAAYGRKVEARHKGLPYPGTFTLDGDGVVVNRHFENSHRIRPTANTLMSAVGGAGDRPVVTFESEGVAIAAWTDTDRMSANQLQSVNVSVSMADDVHVYVDPSPDGFRTLSVTVTGPDHLNPRGHDPVPGHPFTMAGLDETFTVAEGDVTIRVPFYLEADRDTAGDDEQVLPVKVTVAYQACTSEVCFVPETAELDLEVIEVPNPAYETSDDALVRPLLVRRLDEGPKTQAELEALAPKALTVEKLPEGTVDRLLQELLGEGMIEQIDGIWHLVRP